VVKGLGRGGVEGGVVGLLRGKEGGGSRSNGRTGEVVNERLLGQELRLNDGRRRRGRSFGWSRRRGRSSVPSLWKRRLRW